MKYLITAAVIEQDGRILVAKRRREGEKDGFWEFPGGTIEAGETAEGCLKRELSEEFGIKAEIGEFVASSGWKTPQAEYELRAYRVKHVTGDFELNAHEEIRWLRPRELILLDMGAADRPIATAIMEIEEKKRVKGIPADRNCRKKKREA